MKARQRGVLGTPLFDGAVKIMLLGAGELGKEVAIEAQRLGVETIAVDRYDDPPAAQVAHRAHAVNMLDGRALKALVRREQPDVIVPEVEAINTDALVELEEEGFRVIPSARATKVTMDRVLLRQLAEKAEVPSSRFAFASDLEGLKRGCDEVGYPCIVKSRMSSGGLGSSVVFERSQIPEAYEHSKREARGRGDEMIVEELVKFDFEVTELPIAHMDEASDHRVSFCRPVGHVRSGSHYHVSWQPFLQPGVPLHGFGGEIHRREDPPEKPLLWSSRWNGRVVEEERIAAVEKEIYETASKVVQALPEPHRGEKLGIFGCELFIELGDPDSGVPFRVYFNEISPRPHDTGMVTLASQDLSEMALHVRAILGLPIPVIGLRTPAASHVVLARRDGWAPTYSNIEKALSMEGASVRLFGKPLAYPERRMGVVLAADSTVNVAREKACHAAHLVEEGIDYG